jgi:hypothetical protein
VIAGLGGVGLTILAVVMIRRRRRKAPVVVWPQM